MTSAASRFLALGVLGLGLAGCGQEATVPIAQGYGPNPTLPEPKTSWTPTVKVGKAVGWSGDAKPTAGQGMQVVEFAGGLDHPRRVYALPNGDVLAVETAEPAKTDEGHNEGIKGWIAGLFMQRAGAKVPSADRITLLRDADGDGKAEFRSTLVKGLHSPFGVVLSNGRLWIANTDAIVSVPYKDGDTEIAAKPEKLVDLPGGPLNHHWTKDLTASKDGKKLYATSGSNSNVAENGMDAEKDRAAVLEVDVAAKATRLFASGLRNPNGPTWNPVTGELWVAVNERDEIGSDLVPDYMTSVKDGGFYGWPYSYYGQHVDDRVQPPRPDLVAKAIKPDYALGPHTASLGMIFNEGGLFGEKYKNGVFVGQHGSWNRKPVSGYKVIFVPFKDGKPSGPPEDVLTDFLNKDGEAQGRPVGVAVDKAGGLLVADDVGNKVWRVTPAKATADAGAKRTSG
ncbi:PQQ-dependent sugar dehydrogenase [Hansschlegelia zhihuaiae]|uniref:Sorbosone dehydrogenase family protein n=1 Tax=Hansschlegelia zhihuaiae TaxID=405005 RepID=A0A4V1KJV8_9HYPH|nr:sorbosone dehydrogenase family protein [Hansschlegelia zhihuaiae]RXF75542.1 sorbosone dehydrogenase family protein [Hansschlegelia zhihuaiae]